MRNEKFDKITADKNIRHVLKFQIATPYPVLHLPANFLQHVKEDHWHNAGNYSYYLMLLNKFSKCSNVKERYIYIE